MTPRKSIGDRDRLEVAFVDERRDDLGALGQVGRILAAEERIEEPAVVLAVDPERGGRVLGRVGRRVRLPEIERDPDPRVGRCGANHRDGKPVREQQMVGDRDGRGFAPHAWCVLPHRVADPCDDPRLVVGCPVADTVAESLGDDGGVLDERLGGRALAPTALVLERLRQVPVVQREEGIDPVLEQRVDEPVVEVEPGRVHAATSFRQDARPRDGEAECVEAELLHQADVVGKAVVEVAGDRSGLAVPHLPRRGREPVPDALAAPVLGRGALDLVGGRSGTPEEVGGDRRRLGHESPFGSGSGASPGAVT